MKMTKGGFDYLKMTFGKFSQSQVDGLNLIVDSSQTFSYPQVAYMLATAWHETAGTMQPITEYGSVKYFDKYDTGKLANQLGNTPQADGDGYKYRGRGYVQITGLDNYKKFSKLLNVDLVANPDLALNHNIALKIMQLGMKDGLFTGLGFNRVSLNKYSIADYERARKIINGTDQAGRIARNAVIFEIGLRKP